MPNHIETTMTSALAAADFEGDRPRFSYHLSGVCGVCDARFGGLFFPTQAGDVWRLLEKWAANHKHEAPDD